MLIVSKRAYDGVDEHQGIKANPQMSKASGMALLGIGILCGLLFAPCAPRRVVEPAMDVSPEERVRSGDPSGLALSSQLKEAMPNMVVTPLRVLPG